MILHVAAKRAGGRYPSELCGRLWLYALRQYAPRAFGIIEVRENFSMQQFVAEATVKTLRDSILPKSSWFDVQRVDACKLQNATHRPRNAFGTVVTPYVLGHAASLKHAHQHVAQAVGRDRT